MELFEGILPPGSSGPRKVQQKIEEHVLWATFEDCDINGKKINGMNFYCKIVRRTL